MSESAVSSLRELKRWETSRRITVCAQQLTDRHGLDGFTMEDLAEAAEVSRRTLFNYFPSKIDAVLGEHPEISCDALETFRAGGPHGDLLEDLAVLARTALAVKQADRESVALARRVMSANPRLLAAAHERFESITEDFTALVLEREGADFGQIRSRLLLRLLLALFDSALFELVGEDDDRLLADIFDDLLRYARELFA